MQLFKRNKLKQVKCRYLLGTKQLRAEVNKWLVRKRQVHFFFPVHLKASVSFLEKSVRHVFIDKQIN